MNKGDIVLVPFPFTDLTGNKNRPAVILIETEDDVTVCFISTRLKWQSEYDIVVQPTKLNGIKKPSLIRLSKLATLDKGLIIGRLGVLDIHYTNLMNKNLIRLLKLELK
jgi:mRNA interferase MazF